MTSLATLADLKTYLGLSAVSSADTELQRMLDMASTTAENFVGRSFASATYTERRNGWGFGKANNINQGCSDYGNDSGSDMMRVHQWPITAITSVTISGTVISAGDGVSTGYWFENDTIYLLDGQVFTRGRKNVIVVYTAGYTTIPADVVHAVIEIAAQAYREKDWIGHQSKSLAGETTSFLRGFIPDSAKVALLNYVAGGHVGD